MVFGFLDGKDAQGRDAKLIGAKAFDLSGDRVLFEIKNCGGQSKIEERLLAVAERVEAAFD